MRRREKVRELPDSDRVFGVRLGRGDHVFRTPGRLADAPITKLRDDVAMMGAIIGLSWLHPELDLEAEAPGYRASEDEWRAYGDSVLLELDDADYLPAEVDGLAGLLIREWTARVQIHGEARERADFFPLTRGSLISRRSTSRSGILAAVADSGS